MKRIIVIIMTIVLLCCACSKPSTSTSSDKPSKSTTTTQVKKEKLRNLDFGDFKLSSDEFVYTDSLDLSEDGMSSRVYNYTGDNSYLEVYYFSEPINKDGIDGEQVSYGGINGYKTETDGIYAFNFDLNDA